MGARIRFAEPRDAAAIQAIYAPFCESTAISFELRPPSVDEMAERIAKISSQYPWLVCEIDGRMAGYVYACSHRERAAYRWAVDVTVYVDAAYRRRGVGRALYSSLLALLRQQGYSKAYAGITLPNPGSVGVHEAMGFVPVAVYREGRLQTGPVAGRRLVAARPAARRRRAARADADLRGPQHTGRRGSAFRRRETASPVGDGTAGETAFSTQI